MAKLILSSDGFKCINMKFGVDEDSLAHLAVKSGCEDLVIYLRYSASIDLSLVNKRKKKFYEVMTVSNPDWAKRLKQLYDEYQKSLTEVINYKPNNQRLHDNTTAKRQTVRDGVEKQKKTAGTRTGRAAFTSQAPASAQSIEAAAKAELELLALLDKEAVSSSDKGRKGNGKGKKKK